MVVERVGLLEPPSGAEVELDLLPREAAALADAVRAVAPGAPPSTLPFYRAAYAAMEVASWTLAAGDAGLAPDEARQRRAQADRAIAALRRALFPAE